MIILGLTGSIGMGKTTAANMLKILGLPVHDADMVARQVTAPGGKALPALAAGFPYFQYPEIYGPPDKYGRRPLKRDKLSSLIFKNAEERQKLENIIHPFVRESQQIFLQSLRRGGRDIGVLDIPLLFETGADKRVDCTLVVTAPHFLQQSLVLARPAMSPARLKSVLDSQMPDGEKQARADFIVQTGLGRAHTMRELKRIVAALRERHTEPCHLKEPQGRIY